MQKEEIITKVENVFFELGFTEKIMDKKRYLVYQNCYCIVTFIKDLSAFVIESADNYEDAKNCVLEDGDLYFLDTTETELLSKIKNDLLNDYMN